MTVVSAIFRIRRDTAANWTSVNPVLKLGEPGLETDTRKVKYGDGSTAWNSLAYAYGDANSWQLVSTTGASLASGVSWTYSSNVPYVDFTNLGRFSDLMLVARNITLSASDQRMVRCSVDNGANFYAANGDYTAVASDGVESATGFSGFAIHSTASAAARSGSFRMLGVNLNTPAKVGERLTRYDQPQLFFTGSSLPVNALRFLPQSGSANITGGTIALFGR